MKNQKNKSMLHTFYLLLTALIWGGAFVAQSAGNVMGPFTFNCLRNLLGGLVLIPFIYFFYGNLSLDRTTLLGGLCCGLCLFVASNVQQFALQYTTPGKAGFITASYMVMVPIAGVFMGKRPDRKVIAAVLAGVIGLYLLCIPKGEGLTDMNYGDLLCLLCAGFFTVHILCIDHFVQKAEGVKMSCLQFLTCTLLSGVLMLLFEEPRLSAVGSGLVPLLYAGILSSGVAYSLQIVGQRDVNPSVAALILSLESCFSVIAGWLILKSRLNGRELLGCLVMFLAIVLTQLPGRGGAQEKERAA